VHANDGDMVNLHSSGVWVREDKPWLTQKQAAMEMGERKKKEFEIERELH
jgi:hypothetical protein